VLKDLFTSPKYHYLWLVLRLYLGYQWILAGYGKITNPAGVWVGDKAGVAIKGFWMKAAGMAVGPDGSQIPAMAKYAWYQSFLQFLVNAGAETWFSYLIVGAEIAVAVGLILGILTGWAALGSALLNLNFMLAGVASTNPVLYTIAILIMIAGKNADRIGLQTYYQSRTSHPSPGETPAAGVAGS